MRGGFTLSGWLSVARPPSRRQPLVPRRTPLPVRRPQGPPNRSVARTQVVASRASSSTTYGPNRRSPCSATRRALPLSLACSPYQTVLSGAVSTGDPTSARRGRDSISWPRQPRPGRWAASGSSKGDVRHGFRRRHSNYTNCAFVLFADGTFAGDIVSGTFDFHSVIVIPPRCCSTASMRSRYRIRPCTT